MDAFNEGNIVVFTDGGIQKGHSCGCAVMGKIYDTGKGLEMKDFKLACKICEDSTNNEAELYGILKAVQLLPINNSKDNPYYIFSDSEYCIKIFTNWINTWFTRYSYDRKNCIVHPNMITNDGKKVKNIKLICAIINTIVHKNIYIKFINVKGHKNPDNDKDILAQIEYYKVANKEIIDESKSAFISKYNNLVDNMATEVIYCFRKGKYYDYINAVLKDGDTYFYDMINKYRIIIDYKSEMEDTIYSNYYILNNAIMKNFNDKIIK